MSNAPPDSTDDPGMPRWVKVCCVIAVVFVIAFAALHLAGGGFRHHMHGAADPEPRAAPTR